MKFQTELASHNTPMLRSSVCLTLSGDIEIDTADTGPTVREAWNCDDCEYSATVSAADIPKLAFEPLKEKFANDLHAVSGLRTWCEAHGIACEFECWP